MDSILGSDQIDVGPAEPYTPPQIERYVRPPPPKAVEGFSTSVDVDERVMLALMLVLIVLGVLLLNSLWQISQYLHDLRLIMTLGASGTLSSSAAAQPGVQQ
jgi:hypothetical protein